MGRAGCSWKSAGEFVGGSVIAFAEPIDVGSCPCIIGDLGLAAGAGVADEEFKVFWDSYLGIGDVFVVGTEAHGIEWCIVGSRSGV